MEGPARRQDKELLFGARTSMAKRKARKDAGVSEGDDEITVGRIEELLGLDDYDDISTADVLVYNLDITNDESETGDELAQMTSFLREGRVRDAVSEGVDLREYAKEIEADLRVAEEECIEKYLAQGSSFATLYRQIKDCDSILERMENLLSGFQVDLGDISREIKNLQDQSSSMSVQLKNRRQVEKRLSGFIDEAIIPKRVVDGVTKAEVNEAYLKFLHVLDDKLNFTERARLQYGNIKACDDLERLLEQLKFRAVGKARTFLLQKVNALKKPKTSVQIMQQNALLKYKYLIEFLGLHAPDTATEVRESYVTTICRIYAAYFKTYVAELTRLVDDNVGKDELIGAPEGVGASTGGVMGFFIGKKKRATRANVFALGNRARLLDDLHAPSIVPHVVQAARAKAKAARSPRTGPVPPVSAPAEQFDFPKIFRSILHLLLDTVTQEYRFLVEFFGPSASTELFSRIFEPSLKLVAVSLQGHVGGCWDTIGVLLLLHIVLRHQVMMEKSRDVRVEALRVWFRGLLKQLEARLRILLSQNVESLRAATPTLLGGLRDTRPHYVTRRYAEFVAATRTLGKGLETMGELLDSGLKAMRGKVEGLLGSLSQELRGKQRTIFLINNFDMLLSVLKERGISAEENRRFGHLLDQRISAFVGGVLAHYYRDMLALVSRGRAAEEKGEEPPPVEEREVARLIRHFGDTWKGTLNDLNEEFRTLFFNFTTGEEILQLALGRLAEMYTAFSALVKARFRGLAKDLVPLPTLTHLLTRSTTLT